MRFDVEFVREALITFIYKNGLLSYEKTITPKRKQMSTILMLQRWWKEQLSVLRIKVASWPRDDRQYVAGYFFSEVEISNVATLTEARRYSYDLPQGGLAVPCQYTICFSGDAKLETWDLTKLALVEYQCWRNLIWLKTIINHKFFKFNPPSNFPAIAIYRIAIGLVSSKPHLYRAACMDMRALICTW